MDHHHQSSDFPGGGRPPRKELQGPRPAPLKVRKESHKIKKPPIPPGGGLPPAHQLPPPQQPRQPVIIYTVSPKVIHANPNEFMTLVQRLTGPDATSSSSVVASSSSSLPHHHHHVISGAISPAARFASIEKTKMPLEGRKLEGQRMEMMGDMSSMSTSNYIRGNNNEGIGVEVERSRAFLPGILSPGPSSLPPISPNLFSPFFTDPITYGNFINNNNNMNTNMNMNVNMPSPFSTSNNNFISPGALISPSSLELLHHILNG